MSSTCAMPSGSRRRRRARRVGSPGRDGQSLSDRVRATRDQCDRPRAQPSSVYHAEANQEAFLVLVGECRLLLEARQKLLRAWDFFHSPPWTEHAFVGAGDAPCVVLMVGAHGRPGSAVSGVGRRSALRRECGRRDVRSGAGICDGGSFPPRAAVVLVTAALGLEPPFAVAVRRHSRTLAQAERHSLWARSRSTDQAGPKPFGHPCMGSLTERRGSSAQYGNQSRGPSARPDRRRGLSEWHLHISVHRSLVGKRLNEVQDRFVIGIDSHDARPSQSLDIWAQLDHTLGKSACLPGFA